MNKSCNRSPIGIHNLTRPEIVADPHRYIDSISELGPILLDKVGKLWVRSGYAEPKAVLADYRQFSSTRAHDAGELFTDPPIRNRVRDPMRGEFTKGAAEARDTALRELVDKALHELPTWGSFDLVDEYTATFSPRLVTLLLGMPEREADLTRWTAGYEWLIGSLSALPRRRDREVLPALREAMAAFRAEVRRRRNATLTHLITTGLLRLAENPGQRQMLRTDPELIDGAIDEFPRIDGSSQYVARRATEEIEIGGEATPTGDTVLARLAAANLDSRVFTDPKRLGTTRHEAKHLGFGLGRHYRAGTPLAERMARWAIPGFLGRFDEYGLADRPDALSRGRYANTRCPPHAWVRTGPAGARETADTPSGSDRHRQVEEWNNTATPIPPHNGRYQLVEYWARRTPHAPAAEDERGTHSYRTLDRRANALAATLRSYNVQPGCVVAVLMDRSADVAAALAIAKAGGAFLLADPEILAALSAGATIVFPPTSRLVVGRPLWRTLRDHRVRIRGRRIELEEIEQVVVVVANLPRTAVGKREQPLVPTAAPERFPEVNDGEPIELEVLAEVSGKSGTVPLVHGTMDRATAFRKAATRLTGWTVVSYDRRGWAGSRPRAHEGLTLDDHISDLVRAQRTLPKPVVAGHSYGGLVALCAAARRPDLVQAVVAHEPPLRRLPWWPADEERQRLVSEKVPDGHAAQFAQLVERAAAGAGQ